MGLTVHYRLQAAAKLPAEQAYALVRAAHRRAKALARRRGLIGVAPVRPAEPASPWCLAFAKERRDDGAVFHDVPPLRGWMFGVEIGRDCEPLTFALCRYPASIVALRRRIRTNCSGWTYAGHCKTQYASLHGEEHFLRCHRAVIDLLRSWERLGLDVEISDEGSYWPDRDESRAIAEVRQMNSAVAALAGAAKDATNESGAPVQAPIFGHVAFERLEAEGAIKHSSKLADAVRAVLSSAAATKPKSRKPQRQKNDDELL